MGLIVVSTSCNLCRGIDADKLARLQGNNEAVVDPDLIRDSTDEDADRALTSVRIKLDKSLSIEYTVNDLIQQARDPANLGSIFVGCVKLVCLRLQRQTSS